ncbi:TrmB family transcriptional regulator [Paenibacillus roseipurpureus]|uniref:Helix-turn-helix domain-containing protein n=1 Tax=Paenibacillus roseopurpureus TaxID=2918901 RepID=A0AA96LSJ3_9BACL|nr:helix-turn-helix domain-containing protein [Paenibacillus sp. MBLB1832]WNR43945.1 helix-turn-helix domain-containing protein [Paenibacillus sp. MBLB1832]
MENVHQHLKNLGFTDLEAKCLLELAVNGTQTGYEIAKGLGVSRSNVYAALQKLADKGAVLTSHGEPTVYQSVPIEEIGERMEAELHASVRYVSEHLPKGDAQRLDYFSLIGDAKVLDRIRTELRKAKEEVLCDLAPEEAKLLKEELKQAPSHGVRVVAAPTSDSGLAQAFSPFPKRRGESAKELSQRKFTLLIDRKLAIVGTRGGGESTLAMLTEQTAMVELLYHQFCSAIVFHELGQDMGAKLEDKYGKYFKKMIQKYIEPKRAEEVKIPVTKLIVEPEVADELGRLEVAADPRLSDESSDELTTGSKRNELLASEGKLGEGKSTGKRKKKK